MPGGDIDSVAQSSARAVEAPDLRPREKTQGDLFEPVLPQPAPVTPLGIQGRNLWLLDASQQLICCDTRLGKNDMVLMFGGTEYLMENFPQWSAPKKDEPSVIVGFNQKTSSEALVMACQRRGIFSPQGRVFGRGAHRVGELGEQLALHMGRRVLIAGQPDKRGRLGPLIDHPAGEIDRRYFPALDELPPPAPTPSSDDEGRALMGEFRKWFWKEPDAAPLLLLGMSGQMHICGALRWRAHAWLAGPTAAGKSSLQKLLRAIHSAWCLHVEDASEAGIRQSLGDDTLPVMIDEAEADDNPEKQRAIVNLAKKASSGAKIVRGGQDHKGQEFTAQSSFLMSSVIHSLVKGEDINRFAVLEMLAVPPRTEWREPDLMAWRDAGRRMHRRMIEQWPRFERTLTDFKREIASHGLAGRWQDTFGTLLACADCLLFDRAPSAESEANDGFGREREWVRMILPMMMRGRAEARTDVERCLAHLLANTIPGAHGQAPETVGQWIMRAMTPMVDESGMGAETVNQAARDRLKTYGLRIITLAGDADKPRMGAEPGASDQAWESAWLAVAYPTCEPLKSLFRGTDWAGGQWTQSLGKTEGAKRMRVRFGALNSENAIVIPLTALRGE